VDRLGGEITAFGFGGFRSDIGNFVYILGEIRYESD